MGNQIKENKMQAVAFALLIIALGAVGATVKEAILPAAPDRFTGTMGIDMERRLLAEIKDTKDEVHKELEKMRLDHEVFRTRMVNDEAAFERRMIALIARELEELSKQKGIWQPEETP